MNVPNQLTILRFFLTFGFIALLLQEGLFFKVAAAVMFGAASLTDYLAGYIARKYHLISKFGKLMDPIADKFLLLAAFFIFTRMDIVEAWMFILIAVREIFITGWRLVVVQKGKVSAAQMWGKVKTVLQITAAGLILAYLIVTDLTEIYDWPKALGTGMYQGIQYVMGAVVAVTLYSGACILWDDRRCWGVQQNS